MFGQFSLHSCRRTKAEQLEEAVKQGFDVVWSRRAGHNRLHFKTADGAQHFMFHVTVVASLNAAGSELSLDDGGWPTKTTRAAIEDAGRAFGLEKLWIWSAKPKATHQIAGGAQFDRRITVAVPGYHPVVTVPDAPMIRAVVADRDSTVEFRYSAGAFHSATGDEFKAKPWMAIVLLHRAIEIAKRGRDRVPSRHDPIMYQFGEEIGPHIVAPGRLGRSVAVGCHTFLTSDVRDFLRRIELENPAEALRAKAFMKARRKRERLKAKAEPALLAA